MPLNVTLNGSMFLIPETGEVGWGGNTTSYLIAIAAGVLQKTGGSFLLSAETDFGGSFGLKSLYYKSRSTNVAATGILRLNNNSDAVSWRNFANSGDLPLTVDTSDRLLYNGSPVLVGSGPSSYVASITGTANQVIASSPTGAVTLSLPQSIATASAVQFGTLGLGGTADPSALLTLTSTTKGLLPSRMTTVQRDAIVSPATGLVIYNTTDNLLNLYNGTSWLDIVDTGNFAHTSLDNLASVAINTSLISDTTNTDDLGSTGILWRTGYFGTSIINRATTNQLVLGTTNTATISATAPAASRTYTMADPLQNAVFSMNRGPYSPIVLTTAAQRSSNVIFDNFDRANSLLNLQFTPTGTQWILSGGGAATAAILDGAFVTSVDTTYASLDYGTLITRISGAFAMLPGGADDPSVQTMTLIADRDQIGLSNMLHLQFSSLGWALVKYLAGSPSTVLTGDFTLERDGTIYNMAMEINGTTVTVIPPVGAKQSYTHADVATIAARYGIWEITSNGASTGTTYSKWYGATLGPIVSMTNSALGGAFPSTSVAKLVNNYGTQTIAGNKTFTGDTIMSTLSTSPLTVTSDNAGTVSLSLANTNAGGSAHARLVLATTGVTTYPFILMSNASQSWTHGIDRGAADSFTIAKSTDLTTNKYFALDTSGNLVLSTGSLTLAKTTNQLVLGTTNTTTITSPAPAASRTYTITDAGGAASFVMTAGTQTIAGQTTLSNASGNPIHGTNTNDSAAAGYIGEYIESTVVSPTNTGASATGFDAASISLTAGDWDVSCVLYYTRNGATFTSTLLYTAISPTSGNSFTGEVLGVNAVQDRDVLPLTFTSYGQTVPTYRVSQASTATWYLKGFISVFTAGQPQYTCRISARRVR